jgi:uroporphyrin-III C-methyltransferase / precorrin-2 dehydrogenase / sirohydrochlorin ferrochelatase
VSENAYLVGLRLTGRRVVVVGGGTVAQRRLPLLVANGADVHVITRSATPAVEAMVGITLTLREFRDGDLEDAWYVIAATDDPDVNAAVVAEAERRHIFCVRADIAREGTAVTPASFEYEGLSVGVLAGGDHRRSAAIRSAIHEALQRGLITAETPGVLPGGVALVGGGPGDPELITVRGRRLLAHADVVVADRLAPPELLAELPPQVEVIDAAKIPYGRAMAQDAINDVLIDRAKAGKFVVRLKGGDPFVFGRGSEELAACREAGVHCEVVPGVSSAIAGPAAAGIPVTARGIARSFAVVTGQRAGEGDEVEVTPLAGVDTVVVLMGRSSLPGFTARLIDAGRDPHTPAACIQSATTPAQRVTVATLATIAEAADRDGLEAPVVTVIGEVARMAAEGVVPVDGGGREAVALAGA